MKLVLSEEQRKTLIFALGNRYDKLAEMKYGSTEAFMRQCEWRQEATVELIALLETNEDCDIIITNEGRTNDV